MNNLNDDEKNFVRDVLNSEGWKHISSTKDEQIAVFRKMATQRHVSLEDRLWYSAEADSLENFFKKLETLLK